MRKVIATLLAASTVLCLLPAAVMGATTKSEKTAAQPTTATVTRTEEDEGSMNMYENSDFIEKEQPELSEETKELISLYQQNPTEENYGNLREKVVEDYDAVVQRKEEKLKELKTETAGKPGGEDIVAEMEDLVQEIYITYWDRINSTMLRFTDPRLLEWRVTSAPRYDYIPVMGAGESIYIKRTPVTNGEYAEYVEATGAAVPSNWVNGTYLAGEEDYPVNFVSYEDTLGYCTWLTEEDGVNTYRLPNESEWELAAGHMPKDADFNCGVGDARTPVEKYADVTRGAHGAVDFWGNVWEWTSTVRSEEGGVTVLGVKGGSWKSERTDCRTEYRGEGRDASQGYEDVGFRVIQVLNGEEPEQKVELTTLPAPEVSAIALSDDTIQLTWQEVTGATAYQLFSYDQETGLVRMLDHTSEPSYTATGLAPDTAYSYIVQPFSYTAFGDTVSGQYAVTAVTSPAGKDLPFRDVAEDAWYASAVGYVWEQGLMSGTGDGIFSPDAPTTRGMIATILWRYAGSPMVEASADFTDVDPAAWYAPAVRWASGTEIMSGYGDGLFGPDDPATREQLAVIMYRFAQAKGWDTTASADLSVYGDAGQISAYAREAFQWANGAGIINGTSDTALSPRDLAPRSHVAAMLMNFCQTVAC